jgi:hypothetical protein
MLFSYQSFVCPKNNLYLPLKEAVMAKNDAKESARLRTLRIDGSQNGATLRTRIVRDKTKYSRTLKHKKSLADAGDFPFIQAVAGYLPVAILP